MSEHSNRQMQTQEKITRLRMVREAMVNKVECNEERCEDEANLDRNTGENDCSLCIGSQILSLEDEQGEMGRGCTTLAPLKYQLPSRFSTVGLEQGTGHSLWTLNQRETYRLPTPLD